MRRHRFGWLTPRIVLLLIALFAVACGASATATSPPAATTSPPATAAPGSATATSQSAATPTPVLAPADQEVRAGPGKKRGGILRIAPNHADPAHFDLVQSQTSGNLHPQSPMYDGLVRFSPFDGGKTIISDLAHSWNVSDDGLTYTFFLREGVKFHDGALLTSDDVVASWSRIIWPPEGVTSPRALAFEAVKEVNALDPSTVEFVLNEPRAITLSAIAQDWNGVIVPKKTLEEHNYDLRRVKDYPGTGAFRFVDSVSGEKWTLERNPDYWNQGLPYLDGIEIFHAPNPKMVALVAAGRIDWSRNSTTDEQVQLAKDKGLEWTTYPATVLGGVLLINHEREPFNDPRVRKAMDLVIDRQGLLKATERIAIRVLGGYTMPGTEFAPSEEELLKVPGFRPDKTEDIKEAKRLMAEAGYPNGFGPVNLLQRDSESLMPFGVAAQEMLKRHLGIEIDLLIKHITVWFPEVERGDWDLAVGGVFVSSSDPSEYMNIFYKTKGGQNYGKYSSEEFDAIMLQVDRELDPVRRRELVQRAEEVLRRDVPFVPGGWSSFIDIWHPYVKDVPPREFAGIY